MNCRDISLLPSSIQALPNSDFSQTVEKQKKDDSVIGANWDYDLIVPELANK